MPVDHLFQRNLDPPGWPPFLSGIGGAGPAGPRAVGVEEHGAHGVGDVHEGPLVHALLPRVPVQVLQHLCRARRAVPGVLREQGRKVKGGSRTPLPKGGGGGQGYSRPPGAFAGQEKEIFWRHGEPRKQGKP